MSYFRLVELGLWYTNYCTLFNAKYTSYIYIYIYIWFVNTFFDEFLNELELIFLHTDK